MHENLRHQRDTSLGQLEALMQRGRQIRAERSVDATRAWQQDCAAAINQLSGGSKAHWLARAFSAAFLVRAADGGVIVQADAADIVDRILDVLLQGASSLSRMDEVEAASSAAGPRPRLFEFVHNAALRPVFEQAFDDSRRALEHGRFGLALTLSCGIIEAVITDALLHCGAAGGAIVEWPFEARIAAAERAGVIRGGCARLPAVARRYKDLTDAEGQLRPDAVVSERDARVAGQVLRVVMRDLDPGR
jgi:hypothetical protein